MNVMPYYVAITTRIAATAKNLIVISLDYKLAPEYPFPCPIANAILALRWIQTNIALYGGNPNQIYVSGKYSICALLASEEQL